MPSASGAVQPGSVPWAPSVLPEVQRPGSMGRQACRPQAGVAGRPHRATLSLAKHCPERLGDHLGLPPPPLEWRWVVFLITFLPRPGSRSISVLAWFVNREVGFQVTSPGPLCRSQLCFLTRVLGGRRSAFHFALTTHCPGPLLLTQPPCRWPRQPQAQEGGEVQTDRTCAQGAPPVALARVLCRTYRDIRWHGTDRQATRRSETSGLNLVNARMFHLTLGRCGVLNSQHLRVEKGNMSRTDVQF